MMLITVKSDTRPINEAWGENASISDCFANPTSFGLTSGGRSLSDISLLVNTETMSFGHRVSAIEICELPPAAQSARSLIQSIQMYLGVDGEEDIELEVIGFHYGACEKVEIAGDLLTMEIFFIPRRGVHKIAITDTEKTTTFGHKEGQSDPSDTEKFFLRFADSDKRPIGLQGRWKNNGLTALGIITLDTECIPKDGVYVEPGSGPEPEKEIVYVEVEKVLPAPDPIIKESDPTGIIIAVVVTILILIIVNLLLCFFCIKKHKKRIQSLETEKVDWGNKQKERPQLVAVGDAIPEEIDEEKVADDSARRPLYEESVL